jgi:CHAT domain-containing protein/tetratricopeptide (TPR) repeat protein
VLEARERLLGPDHPGTLYVVNNLGTMYTSQGRPAVAEPLLLRALEGRERVLGRDHSATLTTLGNLASMYKEQGRSAEAEPLYLRMIEASQAKLGPDDGTTLSAIGNLAQLYQEQGRFAEAEPLMLRVMNTRERVLGPDHLQTLIAINNLASLYQSQSRYASAEPLYLRALAQSERALGVEHRVTFSLLDNLALLYDRMGQSDTARPLRLRALAGRAKLFGEGHPSTLLSMNNLALSYVDDGQPEKAEPLLAAVLAGREHLMGAVHPETASSAANLAALRLYVGTNPASALGPARLVAESFRARRRAGAVGQYGEAQADRESLQRSEDVTLLADASWAAAQAGAEDRDSATAEAFGALQDAVSGTTERAVVRMAVRRLAEGEGADLGSLVRERETLNDRWARANAGFVAALAGSGAEAEAARAALRSERAGIEVRMEALDARLRSGFPQYFTLVRPEAVDLAAAREMLAPDEAILLVVPTQFGTQVLAIDRYGAGWARSSWKQKQVDDAVRRLLWDVGASVEVSPAQAMEWQLRAPEGNSYDRKTAFALYREIVAPVADRLQGKRHVFIAASGSLSGLPFGILVTEEPRGSDSDPDALRGTKWLADAYALAQIPSVQSLQFLRRYGAGRGGGGEFIGFGDPALNGAPVARGRGRGGRPARSGAAIADLRQLAAMNRLPGTAVELEDLRRSLGAPPQSLFLAERATERAVRTTDLSHARILALATHGLMAGEAGAAEPGLVFTPPPAPGPDDDGLLTASEVSALRLDADWVIMSACNTAAGDGSAGAPGLSGLARAFFYAGARTLLASHWPVGDDVAARLTVRTLQIQRSTPGISRAESLQRAMREVRSDKAHDGSGDSWAHPSAWAPFSLIGDGAR